MISANIIHNEKFILHKTNNGTQRSKVVLIIIYNILSHNDINQDDKHNQRL